VREREKKKKKKSTLDAAAFPVKGEKEIDLEGLKKKGVYILLTPQKGTEDDYCRMMSESPTSVTARTEVRKSLPQAVPNSTLLPV